MRLGGDIELDQGERGEASRRRREQIVGHANGFGVRGCGGGSFRGSPKAPLDSAEAPREHLVYTLCTLLWYAFLDASSANQKKVMVPFSGGNYLF